MKNILIKLFSKYQEDKVADTAAQLSYYLILSIFPFIIALLQIVRLTPLGDMDVVEKLLLGFPLQTQELLTGIIKDIVSSGGVTLFSIGLITAIWSASKGIMSLIKAINLAYDLPEERPFWKLKLLSIGMTLALIIIIVFSLSFYAFEALLFNNYIANHFPNQKVILKFIQGFFLLISGILVLTLLYKYSPSRKGNVKLTFKESLPGGVFSTLGLLMSLKAFSYYVDNFGNYSKVYGSIGGIVVLLIWLYLMSVIIILGAELNSIFMEEKDSVKE